MHASLLNAPALVNELKNLRTDQICKDICVLHIAG